MRGLCPAGTGVHQSQLVLSNDSTWYCCTSLLKAEAAATSTTDNSFISVGLHADYPLVTELNPLVLPFALIFGLLGLYLCVCVCVCVCRKYKVCHFIQRTHSSAVLRLLSLSVPTLSKLSRHSFNLQSPLHHPQVTRQTHLPSRSLLSLQLFFLLLSILDKYIQYYYLLTISASVFLFTFENPMFVQASHLFQRALYMCSEMGGCKKCWEMQLLITLWRCI